MSKKTVAFHCFLADSVDSDPFSEIVFAENRNKAKADFFNEWLDWIHSSYTDVRARRAAWADELPRKGNRLEYTHEVWEVLRKQGWVFNDESESCTRCRLYEFDTLPASRLDINGVCGYCKKKISGIEEGR